MKLFIWEGDGISTGYHDDGTLVVDLDTPQLVSFNGGGYD